MLRGFNYMNARQKKKRIKLQVLKAGPNDILVFKWDTQNTTAKDMVSCINSIKSSFDGREVVVIPKNLNISSENKETLVSQLQDILDRIK